MCRISPNSKQLRYFNSGYEDAFGLLLLHSNLKKSFGEEAPHLWKANLTETQIFRELSIEIERSLFNYIASILIIELSKSNRELSYSIKELSNTT